MSAQTALIVDDSKLARITLQRLLEKRNFTVRLAESASEALTLLEQELPDIIFMDHLMPEIDGFEAMRRIKANPATQHIPVVMCTGKEGTGDYDSEAKAIGAAATLSKPPELEQLNRVLEEAQQASGATGMSAAADLSTATLTAAHATAATAPTASPNVDTGIEERLTATLQKALDELRHEAAEPIAAIRLEQKNQNQIIEQKLEALWAALPSEESTRGTPTALTTEIQSQLTQQQESVTAQLQQLSERLDSTLAQFEQLSGQVTGLAERVELVATQQEQVTPQDDQSATAVDALKADLAGFEQRLEQQAHRLDQAIQELDQRPAPSPGVTIDELADLRALLEQRLAEQHSELVSVQTSIDERLAALEVALHQAESKLRQELREQTGDQAHAMAAPVEIDYTVLEQRATEAALTAVEETFDALIAHKVEQVRNNLALELKAQMFKPADAESDTDEPRTASAAVAADEVRRLAQEAVSDELDLASEHLVSKITDALRERVEESQQELLARQDVFEQERTALRRQIKQLRSSMLLISTGAGLLAVVAFVTAIMT